MGVIGDSGGKDIGRLLVRAAERQHGVVAWWQLAARGVPRWTVDRELARGHLLPLRRGVFAVGHRVLTYRGRWMAAVLACGSEAVLSHHAAAALHQLRPRPQGAVDVTAPTIRSHPDIRAHVSAVPPEQRTRIDRIPATSLERTLLDYAEQATPRQLAAALEAAERRNLLDLRKLHRVIADSFGRRGLRPLRAALAEFDGDPAWTQSELEEAFLELLRATELPCPRTNVIIEGELVDCAWPEHRLIVEIDSYTYHRTRRSFEADRERDAKLQRRGWRVLRITDRRLHADPAGVIADIRAMLANQ
jgi:very-short-patch-repair endonuclease